MGHEPGGVSKITLKAGRSNVDSCSQILPLFTAIAISPSSIIFWTVRGKLVVLLVYCFSSEGRGYIMNLSNAKVGYEMGADVFKRAIWNTGHCYIMNL